MRIRTSEGTRTRSSAQKPSLAPLALPLGLVLLVVWAVGTFALGGPGWLHLLLTAGVFLVTYGIVVRGTSTVTKPDVDEQ
jgi:uncharacterized membrane protein